MKNKWTLVIILMAVSLLHAYKSFQTSGITGRVLPKDGVEQVWAIQGADTLKIIPSKGVFMLEARPGIYKVVVDAKQPNKDVLVESIEVTTGKTTDLGEITVSQ